MNNSTAPPSQVKTPSARKSIVGRASTGFAAVAIASGDDSPASTASLTASWMAMPPLAVEMDDPSIVGMHTRAAGISQSAYAMVGPKYLATGRRTIKMAAISNVVVNKVSNSQAPMKSMFMISSPSTVVQFRKCQRRSAVPARQDAQQAA